MSLTELPHEILFEIGSLLEISDMKALESILSDISGFRFSNNIFKPKYKEIFDQSINKINQLTYEIIGAGDVSARYTEYPDDYSTYVLIAQESAHSRPGTGELLSVMRYEKKYIHTYISGKLTNINIDDAPRKVNVLMHIKHNEINRRRIEIHHSIKN